MREAVGAGRGRRRHHRVIDYHAIASPLMLHELMLLIIRRVLHFAAQHLTAEIHIGLVQMLMIVVYDVIIV